MSATTVKEEDVMMSCASCGIAGNDDIELLTECDDCDLVIYCSVKCQKDHRPKHKKECRKRAAELRNEILFRQPESSHFGDCPICCLPLPIDAEKSAMMQCCSKYICKGCSYANIIREIEGRLHPKCPFCRMAVPDTEEEINKQRMKRIEVNDPVAMCHVGTKRYEKGDYEAAFDYWTKAAALGDAEAHFQLSTLYHEGEGVEKDENRELHHTEQAAIGGHPDARHNLGCLEWENGQYDRALEHWTIAAKLGRDSSLGNVKDLYKAGHASRDEFAAALLGYQAAIEATKSPQREAAERCEKLRLGH